MITYKEQFDKLTSAYIRGEVRPFLDCACFVGNLLNGRDDWGSGRIDYTIFGVNDGFLERCKRVILEEAGGIYTPEEIIKLESIFMKKIWSNRSKDTYEDALFESFEDALKELKKIHESKGEVIDDAPVFVKRKPLAYV